VFLFFINHRNQKGFFMKKNILLFIPIITACFCGLAPNVAAGQQRSTGEKVDDAIDYSKDKADKIKDKVKEGYEKTKDKVKDGYDKTKDKVKDKVKDGLDKARDGLK